MRENLLIIRARFKMAMKIYFRYPLNFIFSCLDPIIWLSPLYFMGKAFEINGEIQGFASYTGNSDYTGFIVLGYMISCYLSTALWSIGLTLKNEMLDGTLESNWSTPANKMAILIGSSLFYFCVTTFQIIITIIFCHFLFGFTISFKTFKIFMFLVPGIVSLIGIGIGISALVLLFKEANSIIDISNFFLSGFSGSFFPIKVLQKPIIFVSLCLPLTYLNDSMRAIMLGQTPLFSLKFQFLIILISMFVFYIGGRMIFLVVEKYCRDKGILSGH